MWLSERRCVKCDQEFLTEPYSQAKVCLDCAQQWLRPPSPDKGPVRLQYRVPEKPREGPNQPIVIEPNSPDPAKRAFAACISASTRHHGFSGKPKTREAEVYGI